MKKATLFILTIMMVHSVLIAQTLEWAKSMAGLSQDRGESIAVDDLGNVYSTGQFSDAVDFDPNGGFLLLVAVGSSDIYVQKLDADGNLLWAKSMGGMGYDSGTSIAIDDSGNVYTTGYFHETVDFDPNGGIAALTSVGKEDIFIQKLDKEGNFLWAKSMGGIEAEYKSSIAVDNSGNVYTSGVFRDTVDFDPGPGTTDITSNGGADIFIQKLDAAGNLVWVKRIGGTGWDTGENIAIDDEDNIYAIGSFSETVDFDPNTGIHNLIAILDNDVFIIKMNEQGNLIWVKSFGGYSSLSINSITIGSSGNVYSTGGFADFGQKVDFDPGPDIFRLTAEGLSDIFIQKLDSSGNFLWAKSMGGNESDKGYDIAVDEWGNVYTTGSYKETVDFDPNSGVLNFSVVGGIDFFIQKLDAEGNLVWATSVGGMLYEEGFSIAVDINGNVYTTGRFGDSVDFDPNAGTYILTGARYNDIFIQKLSQTGVGIENELASGITLYPNPNSGLFQIELPEGVRNAEVQIVDITGRIAHQQKLRTSRNTLSLVHMPPGLYHVVLILGSGAKVHGKVLIIR